MEWNREVLTTVHDARVTCSLKKYELVTNGIEYIGHVIRSGRREV